MHTHTTTGVEDLFDRVRPEILGGGGWTSVPLSEEDVEDLGGKVFMARRHHSADVSLMRAEYVLNLSVAETIELYQPEVYFDTRRPSFDKTIAECGVEELLEELGDAVVWWRPIVSSLGYTACIGKPNVPAQVAGQIPDAFYMCERPTDRHRARWIMRRDFPEVEQATVLMAPFDPESGELLEERSITKATTLLLRPHESCPGVTRMTSVRLTSGVPDWSIAKLARYFLRNQELAEAYRSSSVYCQASETPARNLYVVVGIRKCSSGPPLLPRVGERGEVACVTPSISEWEPAECNTFRLPIYLREFLACLGIYDVDIHGTLDGRRLAPYQAALPREDVERAWAALEQPFRVQKAMYRLRYGGRTAPELDKAIRPRFLPHPSASASPGSAEDRASDRPARRVPVARTFVHFGSFSGDIPRPRSDSMSKLEVASDAVAC